MSAIKDYQEFLQRLKYYAGEIDGDFGPLTLKASLAYQSVAQGMKTPEWLIWAAGELGQKEVYGNKKHNPRIIHYHSFTTLGAEEDEVAWCASFVNAALKEGAEIDGTKSAAAASFKQYGIQANPSKLGAILLIATNTGSRRHVFFNCGFVGNYVFGLGGNQSNAVTVNAVPISKITESRYPKF